MLNKSLVENKDISDQSIAFLPRMGLRSTAAGAAMVVLLAVAALSPSLAATPQSIMPPSGSVMGWRLVGSVHLYNPSTLYALVDGEADAVKAYAFVSCADARYSPNGQANPSIDINVYDMSDPLNAFGLFTQDREGGQPLNIGAGGTRTSDQTGMSFWKGRYLVRIASTTRSSQFLNAMVTFARSIANRIPGSSSLPGLVSRLPGGQQPRTEKYVRSNVEGHAFINNAVTARYSSLGGSGELFIAQYGSAGDAASAYNQFLNYERSRHGRGLANLSGAGQAGFSVQDVFARNVAVARKGPYLIGVVRASNMSAAQNLVRSAAARM